MKLKLKQKERNKSERQKRSRKKTTITARRNCHKVLRWIIVPVIYCELMGIHSTVCGIHAVYTEISAISVHKTVLFRHASVIACLFSFLRVHPCLGSNILSRRGVALAGKVCRWRLEKKALKFSIRFGNLWVISILKFLSPIFLETSFLWKFFIKKI